MIPLLSLLGCTCRPTAPRSIVPDHPTEVLIPAPPPVQPSTLADKPDSPGLPDLVLISIDTLRADHLGSYGYERPTSPFLDSLAARGVRFEHARSPSPWTLPAHTTMFTGQLPTTHLVIEDNLRLADHVPVLPDILRQRGYATAGAVGTLFVSSMYGFHRGFVKFNDFGIHDKKSNLLGQVHTRDAVDDLTEWMEQAPDRPLFLFLHTYDAHYAYDPPPPFATMFDRAPEPHDPTYKYYRHYLKEPLTRSQMEHQVAQYDESIRWIDSELERLDQALREAGRDVRWVVTSDHGEEFGERRSWGHGHTLYAEQLRVPLIMAGPGIPQGIVVEEPVGTHDIAPTLLSWIGRADALQNPDGIDLTPYLSGETAPPARPFLSETSRGRSARLGLFENGRRLEWDVLAGRRRIFSGENETQSVADPGEMRSRTIELLGARWMAAADGILHAQNGARILTEQSELTQPVKAGDRFTVFPFDAKIWFEREPTNKRTGQPSQAAGVHPVHPPLRWSGADRAMPVDLSADTRAALEALGYVQE